MKLCGKKLSTRIFVKYVGVILGERSHWNFQFNRLCLKLIKAYTKFNKIRHYVNETAIYYKIFQPQLLYVCTAWGQNIKFIH